MANVRIKDLTTTAATTASDDFFGVDGATNGTRKLNAYSPTFGGNLTVSGDVLLPTNSAYRLNGKVALLYNGSNLYIEPNNDLGNIIIGASAQTTFGFTVGGNLTVSGSANALGGTNTGNSEVLALRGSGTTAQLRIAGAGADYVKYLALGFNTTSNYGWIDANQAGVGVKPLVVNPSGGNFLIGTTTDGGQKLQVAGTVAFTGDLYSPTAGSTWGADSGATGFLVYGAGGGANANKLVLRTNSTTALTLDNSQNATFAKNIVVSGSAVANPNIASFRSNYTSGASAPYISLFGFQDETTGARIVGDTNGSADLGVGLKIQTRTNAGVLQDVLTFPKNTNNATFAGTVTVSKANAGLDTSLTVNNTDSAANSTSSLILTSVAGSWTIQNNRSGGHLYFKDPATSATQLQINNSTGLATFAGAIAIGNTVQTAAGVASTHKVTISIGGTTYYLLATT